LKGYFSIDKIREMVTDGILSENDIIDLSSYNANLFCYTVLKMPFPQFSPMQERILDTFYNPENRYKELELICGRKSGKSLISSAILLFEVYKMLTLIDDPHEYYGIPSRKNIMFQLLASNREQAQSINFDYIRFPSDGNMKDIAYTWSGTRNKSEVLENFFEYLYKNLKPIGAVLSADLFGMTSTNTDDLNIGQQLEKTLPYFDFVCPMVYPSHFPATWGGYKNPAENPYGVVKTSMGKAVERLIAIGEDPLKLRPWLQDFDLGADYTKELVLDQIKATYDVGLNSWIFWNASTPVTNLTFHVFLVDIKHLLLCC